MCVCVCVCVSLQSGTRVVGRSLCVPIREHRHMGVCMYVCVCVLVCMFVCACVCVCVCISAEWDAGRGS